MSFRVLNNNASNNTDVPAKTFPSVTPRVSTPWVRNPAWPALTAPIVTDQKLVGLYAVWPGDGVGNGGNFFAVTCSGAYTIDFGDGTTTNFATGIQANYEYNFNDVDLYDATVTLTDSGDLITRTAHGYSNGMAVRFYRIVTTTGLTEGQLYYVINATTNTFQVSLTVGGSAVALTNNGSASLLPYKVATVTITPQAGQNLTSINLFVKNTTTGLQAYSTGWLDIAVAGSNITTLTIGSSATTLRQSYLEQANIVSLGGITTFASLFQNCQSLQNVLIEAPNTVSDMSNMFNGCSSLITLSLFNTAAVTDMSSMFQNCRSLTTVPLFNTAAVTTMFFMFNGCSSLTTVPLFNTAAVTNMSSMFQNCRSLTTIPLFNTVAVTNISFMFNGCSSLTTVPLFNTVAATNMSSMFQNCFSLITVPLFNTAAVTNMSNMFFTCSSLNTVPLFNTAAVTNMSGMFFTCSSLITVPLFNTAAVIDMNGMFNGCSSLNTVPLFNTAAVTNISFMFQNCSSLTTVPLFNTAAVTNIGTMFSGCSLLTTVPLFNTASATNMNNMFSNCISLTSVPALNTSAVTSGNFFNIFNSCNSLARIQAKDFKFTFSVSGCKLSATALNEIYTNLPTVVGQTITVTNNYGTATDNPAIATAKGWTVTG